MSRCRAARRCRCHAAVCVCMCGMAVRRNRRVGRQRKQCAAAGSGAVVRNRRGTGGGGSGGRSAPERRSCRRVRAACSEEPVVRRQVCSAGSMRACRKAVCSRKWWRASGSGRHAVVRGAVKAVRGARARMRSAGSSARTRSAVRAWCVCVCSAARMLCSRRAARARPATRNANRERVCACVRCARGTSYMAH